MVNVAPVTLIGCAYHDAMVPPPILLVEGAVKAMLVRVRPIALAAFVH